MEVDEIEKNETPEDDKNEESSISDSILNSIKKMLGLDSSIDSFDVDIIVNINSAIATLTQLGIGPESGYFIIDEKNTYTDYLGDVEPMYQQVKMYLYYKTRIGFDPPSSSYVLDTMKECLKELEWRLQILNEKLNHYDVEGGEISK